MSTSVSRLPALETVTSTYRNLILTLLSGAFMILLARFVLDGPLAGMFGVWGITLIGAGIGGHLLLRLWAAYN